jgi:hypothetical protein
MLYCTPRNNMGSVPARHIRVCELPSLATKRDQKHFTDVVRIVQIGGDTKNIFFGYEGRVPSLQVCYIVIKFHRILILCIKLTWRRSR